MKDLYQKIIRFFTRRTPSSQTLYIRPSFSLIEEFRKQEKSERERMVKQLIRNEVRKQLNKKQQWEN